MFCAYKELRLFIFLNAGLKRIDGARPANARIAPYGISEELESLRNVRNTCFAHTKTSRKARERCGKSIASFWSTTLVVLRHREKG